MNARVLLSLGSNLGAREEHMRDALERVGALDGTRLLACSHYYETEPLEVLDQPPFLNGAAEIETAFEPLELLDALKEIETALGRVPNTRWGPRSIDIDVILWGGLVLDTERLTLPHAAFRERAFVLTPLAEIAPDHVDPVTGKTVAELAARPEVQGWTKKRALLLTP